MKFNSGIVAAGAALLIQISAALDPANCNTSDKSRTGSDFQLTEQADNKHLEPLSKIFSAAGKTVTVADVFNDGNHKLSTNSNGYKVWPTDFNDQETTKWTPQGITSTADALEVGTYEGKNGWLVSWYQDKPLKSVRITFVDRADDSYRHVMLVNPNANDNFTTVPIHAGGIVWYGDTLWVVDTNNGVRVFDMSQIWEVDTKGEGVGKMSGGGYSAATYKYVIPQVRYVHSIYNTYKCAFTNCSKDVQMDISIPLPPLFRVPRQDHIPR